MGMDINAECVPCLLKRVVFQAGLAGNGSEFDAAEAAVKAMSGTIGSGKRSVDVATAVHSASYMAMGVEDPYLGLKLRADEVAAGLLPAVERMVEESDDPLKTAFLAAVVGNIMDFGMGKAIDDPDEFISVFDDMLAQGIDEAEFERVRDTIRSVPGVVYMFDNCGESQFDKVLIRQLRSMGKRVVGVVRGKPILNDVTMDDAVRIGLDRELDAILTTGKFFIGIDWKDVPEELMEEIMACGVIVAKGMANFEASFREDVPVPMVHVMRSKCRPVADSMGVPVGANVVRLA